MDIEEKSTKPLDEINQEMSMSRGMSEEIRVDFAKCEDMFVYDQMGNKIRFGDIYKKKKTIIVLTRVGVNTWQCCLLCYYGDVSVLLQLFVDYYNIGILKYIKSPTLSNISRSRS